MPLVTVENLEKSFKDLRVIKGLNFQLENGKCVALIGANGAGKTTTLKMLSGLLRPTKGKISFAGEKQGGDHRRLIGYLPQHPVFHDWMTAREFLEYVGKLSGLPTKKAKERSAELLELVGIADAKNRRIGKFSGGMKQRLGIAQAIIHRPKLIMLDEPVSALDPFGRREVLELLEKLKKEATVLFSTHILNDAEEVCESILFLHNGEIIESGTMDEFREKYHQSKIDLVFSQEASSFLKTLSKHQQIDSIQMEGNKASIYTENLKAVKEVILTLAAKENWPLNKYEIGSISLEDVFMKVVQK
ncbi:ABC transporter ATP-binding protein [Mesobacillus selenatarsenatis]|uniref:ABC transporter, ATP-binding protein n=1 Tax=Mesobacillus selenatarsenatis (strain DSM 18680 / JCM 14380 / FERM P-15431 / SF-1) TaxID=1321606 RepID=A0A0A8X9W5_MESS1|nr:ABC transporter ATP-binding protein [Mesobacillus selenatarsenatis]GAM16733.1 ABC transporter, ATP-binding protein [Mesobacillus selenatarsenatis SF-1]